MFTKERPDSAHGGDRQDVALAPSALWPACRFDRRTPVTGGRSGQALFKVRKSRNRPKRANGARVTDPSIPAIALLSAPDPAVEPAAAPGMTGDRSRLAPGLSE